MGISQKRAGSKDQEAVPCARSVPPRRVRMNCREGSAVLQIRGFMASWNNEIWKDEHYTAWRSKLSRLQVQLLLYLVSARRRPEDHSQPHLIPALPLYGAQAGFWRADTLRSTAIFGCFLRDGWAGSQRYR